MTDREVRRLSRKELLELLIRESEEKEALQARIAALEKQLADRVLLMEQAGSIAQASLELNHVFTQAQAAADTYLESIRARQAQIEELLHKTQETCDAQILESKEKAAQMEAQTRALCDQMLANIRTESESSREDPQ